MRFSSTAVFSLCSVAAILGQIKCFEQKESTDDTKQNVDLVKAKDGDDLEKRPFGRLFGPTFSKRPFGRLFGTVSSSRSPYDVILTKWKRPFGRLFGHVGKRSVGQLDKRPFGRLFGPHFAAGKRSMIDDNQEEISKRPFGRLFGSNFANLKRSHVDEPYEEVEKRPFGRLFGPRSFTYEDVNEVSKRPFGRLFGPRFSTGKRPSYRDYLNAVSKRPFNRMSWPRFTAGKRSVADEPMVEEIAKRPFGRLFGPNAFGKRAFGSVLTGGYKLGKRAVPSYMGEDDVNDYTELLEYSPEENDSMFS